MYVCLCNGYSETQLRALARDGLDRAEAAFEALGAGPCCGSCISLAQQIIDSELAPSPPLLAAGN